MKLLLTSSIRVLALTTVLSIIGCGESPQAQPTPEGTIEEVIKLLEDGEVDILYDNFMEPEQREYLIEAGLYQQLKDEFDKDAIEEMLGVFRQASLISPEIEEGSFLAKFRINEPSPDWKIVVLINVDGRWYIMH